MPKFPMDLSKFEKISASDKKTTLKHKDGHFIVIAHAKLKPDLKGALDALPFAKGGKVKKMAAGGVAVKEEDARTGGKSTIGPPEPKIEDVPGDKDRQLNIMHRQFTKTPEQGLAKGGKVERARIFGERGDPGKKSAKGKAQMIALIKTAAKRYGLEVVPSQGKIEEETGERRDFDPAQVGGKLKPDWRSGELESQMNPQAISHEMGHLEISEEGKQLPTLQKDMDQNFAETASQFGGRQKQTQGEIQPMAMENPLRRRAGVPAFARPQHTDPRMGHGKEPLTEESPERRSLDTGEKYAQRLTDPETGEMYDLIGLSGNMSPPNMERLQAVDEGSMKFGKGKGWHKTSTPDALINLRGRGQQDEASARAQHMGIQKGKKPSRLYAEGGEVDESLPPLEVEPMSPEEQFTQSSAPEAQPQVEPMASPDQAQAAPPQPEAAAPAPMPAAPAPQRQASMKMAPETVETVNNAPVAPRSISSQMHAEDDALAQDLATGHVTPKTYGDLFAEKSTLGKVGTIFGLLASGLGSGLSHQPNALLKMMDKTIERDLDAQKTSASNRQNFYKIRQQQILNDASIRLTKAQAEQAELGNKATRYGLGEAGILGSGVTRDKHGKVALTPAGEMQARTQAKMDLYNAAAHDLEQKVAKMPPNHPMYAATMGALQTLQQTMATEKQQMTQQVDKAHQAEEDANDPIAKITGVSRSKLPPMPEVPTLLHPGADAKIMGLSAAAAGSPMFKQTFEPLMQQFNAAKQADEVLKDLPKTFQDLSRLRNWSQRIVGPLASLAPAVGGAAGAGFGARGGNPMGGAYVGEGIGEGLKQGLKAVTGTEQNRLYDATVSKLGGVIMNARIPNLGHEEAMRWAHQYAPVAGDSDDAVNWKLSQLADKIRISVPRGLLDAHGFTK